MVKEILKSAGFIENKTFRETRFLKPPSGTYAIYNDSCDRRGADDCNLISEHGYTIEMYSDKPDREKEAVIENVLDEMGVEYHKDERYWIQSEQLYQVIYTFDTVEK